MILVGNDPESTGVLILSVGSNDRVLVNRGDSERLFGERAMQRNYLYQIELYCNMRLNDHKYRLQRKGLA